MKLFVASLLTGVICTTGSATHAFVDENFESFANGAVPTVDVILNGGGTNPDLEVEVADLGTGGIIGATGNQGVALEDFDATDTSLLGYRGSAITQGTASWKYASRRGGSATSTITYFRLGESSSGGSMTFPEMAIELYMSPNGRFFMSDTFNNLIKLNPQNDPDANKPYLTDRVEYAFHVAFDTIADTFSMSIDGIPMVLDSDNTTTMFPFKNSASGIDAIDFTTGSNAVAASLFYLDDIVVQSISALVGDLDGDGFVGITDLNLVLGNWNLTVPPADAAADPSGDNYIGIEDLNLVLGNWNAGVPPSSVAVPEPATLVLLGACGLLLTRRIS
jgi:hypothetical protein